MYAFEKADEASNHASSEDPIVSQDQAVLAKKERVSWSASVLRDVYDFFFPPVCSLCEVAVEDIGSTKPSLGMGVELGRQRRMTMPLRTAQLCLKCTAALVLKIPLPCQQCASPLGPYQLSANCIRCRGRTYRFEQATALTGYVGVGREAVLRLKRAGCESLALSLGQLLATHVQLEWALPFDAIVPVPMHWTRRLWRGVNAPELLAESVGAVLGIPVRRDWLARPAVSRKQGVLLAEARFENVKGAFRAPASNSIKGKRLLLIDDILTTGATASEAARALRDAGAGSVHVAVVARGVGKGTVLVPSIFAPSIEDGGNEGKAVVRSQ